MSDEINKAVSDLLGTIPSHIRYYGMGGDVGIPTTEELALLRAFENFPPALRNELAPIAKTLTLRQADLLSAFTVRMATFAVRKNAIHVLRIGTLPLVVDDNLLDWRNVLMVLSIIDDSALRLGTDLESVIQDAIALASDRRRTTINEYLLRPPAFRGIKVMGIEALGNGDQFRYKKKPFELSSLRPSKRPPRP
jgi:hypothetical protein